ncbi:SRPBCC family protein, partial [Streptomyces niveiscabiei]|uniref:SRPBCC family protein n=1 Tax=Streptomyces niveiscabiei TaxID=164115 RepID=UPI0038F5D450
MSAVTEETTIAAPGRAVWDVVTDYERYLSFFPEFKQSTIIDTEGTAKIVE